MPKPSYAQLIAEHEDIDRLCRELIRTASRDQPDAAELSSQVERLAAIVEDHVAEEAAVLDSLLAEMRRRDDERAAELVAMDVELDALKRDWSDYLAAWTPRAILSDPSRFREASEGMLSRLRARVSRESSMLYAVLLQSSAITLTPR